jgi:outer membrane biosynthesis protein TonB
MPNTATTLLASVLVAFSIGFNSVHYPVVWKMIGPAVASESVPPADQKPKETQEPPLPEQPSPPPPPPIRPIEIKPAPEVAEKVVIDDALPVPAQPAGPVRQQRMENEERTAENKEEATVEPETRKPLVPITTAVVSGENGSGAAGGAGIRRLPPVETSGASLAAPIAGQLSQGVIPVYPTTGIE